LPEAATLISAGERRVLQRVADIGAQDILAAESGWNVTLDYAPAGLRCTMLIAGEQA
jgi:hypothetical protein